MHVLYMLHGKACLFQYIHAYDQFLVIGRLGKDLSQVEALCQKSTVCTLVIPLVSNPSGVELDVIWVGRSVSSREL